MDARLLDWCKRLIATPSVTTDGTRGIAELCAHELLAPAGIEARMLPSARDGAEQVNLLATVAGRDPSLAPLVLSTHLDTVPPGEPAAWSACGGDPFSPIVVKDRIYGLGAADTKLDFAAKTCALIEAGRPNRTTLLIATFGEEQGLRGAREMAELGLAPPGALALVGEPSGLKLIVAHKGLIVFQLAFGFRRLPPDGPAAARKAIFLGRAAHSSTPALGRNAIGVALAALAALPRAGVIGIAGGDAVNKVPARCEAVIGGDGTGAIAGAGSIEAAERGNHGYIPQVAIAALARFVAALEEFARRAGPPDPDYAPPTLTCNPGIIRSAAAAVTLEFELRPPPGLPLEVVRRGVGELVAELGRSAPGIELSLTEKRANPGSRSALDGEAVRCGLAAMARAGLALDTGVKAGCTEAGIYAGAGLQAVVFGPGPSTGVIHAPNEYNLLSEVEGAVRFYRALLDA